MAGQGFTIRESLFEAASTLGTVGLTTGVTGPGAPSNILWTQSIAMLLGRLEFFTVVVGLAKIGMDSHSIAGEKVESSMNRGSGTS